MALHRSDKAYVYDDKITPSPDRLGIGLEAAQIDGEGLVELSLVVLVSGYNSREYAGLLLESLDP